MHEKSVNKTTGKKVLDVNSPMIYWNHESAQISHSDIIRRKKPRFQSASKQSFPSVDLA
jgi:hypothetical protein